MPGVELQQQKLPLLATDTSATTDVASKDGITTGKHSHDNLHRILYYQ
jgi:hypothetical protein